MTRFVEDPVATPEYDAIASALRPHADADGMLTISFAHAVGYAAQAVESVYVGVRSDTKHAQEMAALHESEAAAVVSNAQAEVETARASIVAKVDQLEAELANARSVLSLRNARVEALEMVAVQAKARWDHEGGPQPLRDALAKLREG